MIPSRIHAAETVGNGGRAAATAATRAKFA